MRKELAEVMKDHGGAKTFPYSFEFLYWEEVGIIDKELIRNLAICGAVVSVMIACLIPHWRIAPWVILSIILSVVDLVGFMFYWDVTISGISTIYILISVGLAVDYSAHIAHMFVESTGE
jgi:predicted RND superfamily exporter protein